MAIYMFCVALPAVGGKGARAYTSQKSDKHNREKDIEKSRRPKQAKPKQMKPKTRTKQTKS